MMLLSILSVMIDFLKKIAFAILLYLSPIHDLIHAVIFLIAMDFITGLWASLKAGESFSARKMRGTVNKVALYFIAIISAYVLQKMMLESWDFNITRYVSLFIAATELKSIYENISRILGVQLFKNLFNEILAKLKQTVK